jgi:hypothetical protein
MATGWRVADATTYEGLPSPRGIATPPGAVSEPFWIVDPGKRFACLLLALMIQDGEGVLLEVDYDEADVLEERLLHHEAAGAPWFPGSPPHGTPEDPVQFRARKISAGTVSVALTEGFTEVALAPEGTA